MVERQLCVEHVFDRNPEQALAHAYWVLVPERRARTMQRRDSDDHSQTLALAPGAESRPGPVTDEAEDRPAVGA